MVTMLPRRRLIELTSTACLGLLTAQSGLAQRVVPPDADTSRMRVPVPLPRLPEFDLRIQTPERAPTPRAVDELEFNLKGIKFEGGSRFSEQQMLAFFESIIGKTITLEDFRKTVSALEDFYRKNGFFLTRVFIPPQQVRDGVFTVQIIEGYISETFVDGAGDVDRAFVERLLASLKNKKPIDLRSLEQVLLTLNDIPSLNGTGTLRPGALPGSSELVVTVSPPPKISYVVGVNNTASKTIGPWGFSVNTSIPRPFGRLGTLGLGLSNSLAPADRLHALVGSYSMPIGSSGDVFTLGGLAAIARPGGSLRALNVLSESWSLSPRYRKPLLRSVKHSFFVDLGLSINESEAFLNDGLPTKQAITHDRTSSAEISLSYQQSGVLNGSTQISLSAFQGLDAFGAFSTARATLPSTQGFNQRFSKQTLSLSRQQMLTGGWSLSLLAQAQYSEDNLLSGDQTFFGGTLIGRGYDSGALFGDRGFGTLAEMRWDPAKPASFGLPENLSLQLFGSYDFARATRLANLTAGSSQSSNSIASTALGLRIRDPKGLSVEAMIANANTFVASNDRKSNPRVLFTLTKIF